MDKLLKHIKNLKIIRTISVTLMCILLIITLTTTEIMPPYLLIPTLILGIVALATHIKYRDIIKAIENIEKIYQALDEYAPKQKDTNKNNYVTKTKTITDTELYFLNIIRKHFDDTYEIRPQVPLVNVVEKIKNFENEYQNELFRVIDIGIFDKQTTAPLLLIEINDATHNEPKRIKRDARVKFICYSAGIPLITFWTNKSNTEEYIINRISEKLKKDAK